MTSVIAGGVVAEPVQVVVVAGSGGDVVSSVKDDVTEPAPLETETA